MINIVMCYMCALDQEELPSWDTTTAWETDLNLRLEYFTYFNYRQHHTTFQQSVRAGRGAQLSDTVTVIDGSNCKVVETGRIEVENGRKKLRTIFMSPSFTATVCVLFSPCRFVSPIYSSNPPSPPPTFHLLTTRISSGPCSTIFFENLRRNWFTRICFHK